MKNKISRITIYYSFFILLIFAIQCSVPQSKNEIPITSSSDEAIKLFLEGREKMENLNAEQAVKLFDQAIELDPEFAQAYHYRAANEVRYKEYHSYLSKALDLIEKVSEGEKHLILYQVAFSENNRKNQKKELNELLRMYPNDKRVQNIAGVYYQYIIKDYNMALVHFENSVNLDPNFAPNYNYLGYLYKTIENLPEAEKAFQKYISLIPDEANPYDSYAEFLLHKGSYSESIAQYEKAYDLDPSFIISIAGIGNNYIFLGEYDKARKFYRKYYDEATDIYDKVSALFRKALSYIYEDKIDETIAALEERAVYAKANGVPNYVLSSYGSAAFILDEMERYDEAELYYKKSEDFIKEADFTDSDRIINKLGLDLDICYHKIMNGELKDTNDVITACREPIKIRENPSDSLFLNHLLGLLESKNGNYERAVDYYAEADRESPDTWYHEGLALVKSGKKDKAKKTFEKIVNWNVSGLTLAVVRNKALKKLSEL
jgi:tetratricopeptide (TPR) repeat protein